MKLHLGCGRTILSGWVNVDIAELPGVDVVHDLDQPWPWPDRSATEIRAWHIFEHVADPIRFMCEAWRVLCGGGRLNIISPHWQSPAAFTDPTHRRFPTAWTWDYWIEGTELHREYGAAYGGVTFRRVAMRQEADVLNIALSKRDTA